MSAALIRAEGLSVRLGGRSVLSDVDLTVAPGECLGLIGPNGAGKSTAMRALLGLQSATGTVSLGGEPVGRLSGPERARRAAFVPQEREIGWPVTVESLVALGRLPHRGPLAAPGPRDRALVEGAMDRMDVLAFRDRRATDLSGGERARVLIARALAQDAPLLLADEPTAGLDPSHQIGLMETFAALRREGRGVLASLHDLGLAARWCDRLVLLAAGRVVAEGPPRDVLTRDRLAEVYGVRVHLAWAEGGPILQPVGRASEPPGRVSGVA